jgi:hypothetical protein
MPVVSKSITAMRSTVNPINGGMGCWLDNREALASVGIADQSMFLPINVCLEQMAAKLRVDRPTI